MLNEAKPSKTLTRELVSAAAYVCDQIKNDLDAFSLGHRAKAEIEFDSLECSDYLPRKHGKRYDPRFFTLWKICVQHVAWKIVAREALTLACTGEELALRAISIAVRRDRDYKADIKGRKRKKTDDDVDRFEESAVWDGDVDLLFDESMDGIEDHAPPGHDLANLSFKDWFKPFRDDNPVHPFLGEYGG